MIIHKTDRSLLLCYVAHHDDAYAWANRRKIEQHPKTGAAQLVEVRERVEEVTYQPLPAPRTQQKPLLFAEYAEDDLLSYGIPREWLPDVRQATEDSLFDLADHLPQEAIEVLLELATGGKPSLPKALPTLPDPFSHPDAQRRFRVMTNRSELEKALDFPWEKWTVFSSSTPPNAPSSNANTQGQPAFPALLVLVKPSWHYIEPYTSLANIPKRGCCSPHFLML